MFQSRLVLRYYSHFSYYARFLSRTPSLTDGSNSTTDTYLTQYGSIPIDKLDIKYTKSRGPGGQNVNKVNSRVQLRFRVKEAEWLPEIVREAILEKHKNRLTKEGELLLESQLYRTQYNNMRDAITKLQSIIENVYKIPGAPSEEKMERIAEFKEKFNESRRRFKSHRKRRKQDLNNFLT